MNKKQSIVDQTKTLIKKYKSNYNNKNPEIKIAKGIKTKLEENKSIAVKADKGNTLFIIPEYRYHKEVYDILTTNEIEKIHFDATSKNTKNKLKIKVHTKYINLTNNN